jgi:hypothetical protein
MTADSENDDRLTSRELASLIGDALLRGRLLGPDQVEKAIAIANEEIEARKAVGDY